MVRGAVCRTTTWKGYRMLAQEVEMPVLAVRELDHGPGDVRGGGEVGVLEVGEDGCAGSMGGVTPLRKAVDITVWKPE